MPSWYTSGTLYKGLSIIVLALIALEYLYGSTRNFQSSAGPSKHSPLLFRLHSETNMNSSSSINISIPAGNSTEISTNNVSFSSAGEFEAFPESTQKSTSVPLCPDVSTNLVGRVEVSRSPVPTVGDLERRFSWLKPGGHWAPSSCRVPKSVALIIPFRCRGEHLLLFLQHMHPFLQRQQIDYTIYIVEQDGEAPFNRALLMNVGFTEALKMRKYDCFIFHDIDLLPEDDRNLYTCPPGQPRHMSVAVDVFNYKLPYPTIFGGVSAINTNDFKLLNGFSNSFWGWGGEDDDMANRIRYHNLYISRYPTSIARYTMLKHDKDKPSPRRYDVLKEGQKRFDKDGLNNLKYSITKSKKNLLYTWLLVGINEPS